MINNCTCTKCVCSAKKGCGCGGKKGGNGK